MIHPTESKFQPWRALAFLEGGGESLLCLGLSSKQVRTGYESACDGLLDAHARGRIRRIALECWRGAADQGRWVAKAELPVPAPGAASVP